MRRALFGAALILAGLGSGSAMAADKVRVVSTLKGFWDTTLVEFGRQKGIFEQDGLDLDVVFAQGGGSDVLQTVIAGGADVGVGTGTAGALAAVTKGAPLAIVGAEFTGASDIYFYAKASSPIRSFKDIGGLKVGISHQGSTTETITSLLAEANGTKVDTVVTGGPPATITQVMTNQVDVGWSVYPIGLDKVASGELRIIASGNDAPGMAEQNARVVVASKDYIASNEEVLRRFFKAYDKVVEWAYTTDEALQMYADIHKISLDAARETVAKGYPREAVDWGRVGALDVTIDAAVKNKVLDKPLTEQEIAEAFKLVKALHE